jgi:hypothetical protein
LRIGVVRFVAASDILVQIHIPKCAGTSVGLWLREAALAGVISGFRALYPDYVYAESDLWSSGFDDARLAAVTTHNVRRFASYSGDRRVRYFTLLREPRAHVLSGMRYMLQDRQAFGVPDIVASTTRALAAWLLDRSLDAPFRENVQTNHLALYVWCDATSGRCDPDHRAAWSALDRAVYERERLDIAKDVLRSFLAVGTVERLPASLELLRARCAAIGLQLLPVERLRHVNVTTVPLDDVSWIDTEPLGARLRESLATDGELYAFTQGLLADALAQS